MDTLNDLIRINIDDAVSMNQIGILEGVMPVMVLHDPVTDRQAWIGVIHVLNGERYVIYNPLVGDYAFPSRESLTLALELSGFRVLTESAPSHTDIH